MTEIVTSQVSHPSTPLVQPVQTIGTLLSSAILDMSKYADKQGLDIDWSSLEIHTEVQELDARSFSDKNVRSIEIRSHLFRVRAQPIGGQE